MPEAVIIGAGVTGLSTAYHLSKRASGRITVIGKGPIGDGSAPGVRRTRRAAAAISGREREPAGHLRPSGPHFEIPHAECNLSSLTINAGLRRIAWDRLAALAISNVPPPALTGFVRAGRDKQQSPLRAVRRGRSIMDAPPCALVRCCGS